MAFNKDADPDEFTGQGAPGFGLESSMKQKGLKVRKLSKGLERNMKQPAIGKSFTLMGPSRAMKQGGK